MTELTVTCPRLLTPTATLSPAPPSGLPRSSGVPAASHSTACSALGGRNEGMVTFEHRPEKPTTCPWLLFVNAKETVSFGGRGGSGVGRPFGAQFTPSNPRT